MKGSRTVVCKRGTYPILTLATWVLLAVCLIWTPKLFAAKRVSTKGLRIDKITIGEDTIATGRKQLVEVLVKNASRYAKRIVVRLYITLPNRNSIHFKGKKVLLKAKTDTRVLIPYPIDKKRGGDYTVGARLYTTNGKILVRSSHKQNKYFFAVDPSRSKQMSRRRRGPRTQKAETPAPKKPKAAPQPVLFDPPDLLFQKVSITGNNSVLRGDTAHVRLVLTNNGGDVAADFQYSVHWYFIHRPKRKIPIGEERVTVKIIAPGERKIFELPFTIPETEQKGEYLIQAVVDDANRIEESNENNNAAISDSSINFSDIALEFPRDSHSFAEEGLFQFKWRSRKFNQFKVQVSTDEYFTDEDAILEMPMGEKWQSAFNLRAYEGEMQIGDFMQKTQNKDFLFWRVKAQNSQGEFSESAARKFHITFKASLD